MIKVDKNITKPKSGSGSMVAIKYPFGEMAEGDSFFVPEEGDKKSQRARIASASCVFGKRHKMKFSLRKVYGGLRVWRVAIEDKGV